MLESPAKLIEWLESLPSDKVVGDPWIISPIQTWLGEEVYVNQDLPPWAEYFENLLYEQIWSIRASEALRIAQYIAAYNWRALY